MYSEKLITVLCENCCNNKILKNHNLNMTKNSPTLISNQTGKVQ